MTTKPEKALIAAVKGMIPKNKLANKQITRLKVFKNDEHKHNAQISVPQE